MEITRTPSTSTGPQDGYRLEVIYSGQRASLETVSPFASQVMRANSSGALRKASSADIKRPSRLQQFAKKFIRPQQGEAGRATRPSILHLSQSVPSHTAN